MQMMVEMSRLLDEYGLDVWIWYPAMDKDYSDPQTVEFALNEWGEVFKKLPRIDAIFVPGGDPGHTEPKFLMALLEKETRVLHQYHPKAQMWMSPQSFNQQWLDEFLDILNREQPAWLTGVVFGPQVRISLPELRAKVPKRYPIRHYPDITHSLQCQYPVPDWDVAYAVTEGREVINPRPIDEAAIFRLLQPYTIGFLTYSEGCNDDVNKFVWSALGWNPRPTSSTFFASTAATSSATNTKIRSRRDCWRWSATGADRWLTNAGVVHHAGAVSDHGSGCVAWNAAELALPAGALSRLLRRLTSAAGCCTKLHSKKPPWINCVRLKPSVRSRDGPRAADSGSFVAEHPAADWRARVFELAEALFQSIRMQLSVEKYKAISVDRGATLDTIDLPLNSRVWLEQRFADIRKMENETDRRAAIDEIFNWTNPGPAASMTIWATRLPAAPGSRRRLRFRPGVSELATRAFGGVGSYRKSFWTHAASLNDEPLRMRYTDLDPAAQYKIRVVYGGDSPRQKIRLVANGAIEIHPFIAKPVPYRPIEFDIPREATRNGVLNLAWTRDPGQGGNGRGCQVAEMWLIKK